MISGLLVYKACKVVMPLAVLRPKRCPALLSDRVQLVTDGRKRTFE